MVPDPQENTKHCFHPPREAILSQTCEYQWIYDVNLCVQFKVKYAHTFTCIIILIFLIACFAYADQYWYKIKQNYKKSYDIVLLIAFFSIKPVSKFSHFQRLKYRTHGTIIYQLIKRCSENIRCWRLSPPEHMGNQLIHSPLWLASAEPAPRIILFQTLQLKVFKNVWQHWWNSFT